jgi:Domain of unknown function (DUF222)/HNH endonuclease
MSAALTPEVLEGIWPPPGDVGERMAVEFERTIQTAMGRCNAADARLVQLVRRALLEGFWRQRGCHSPEHWVCAQLGLDSHRARRIVGIAMALGDYPETAARFAAGLLTEAHVQVIVTRVDPAQEAQVAGSAGCWNIAQLRRWSANFPKPIEPVDTEPETGPETEPEPVAPKGSEPEPFDLPDPDPTPARTAPDRWSAGWDDRGRYTGRFDLGPEVGSLLEKTLAAGRSRTFTERTGTDPDDPADDADLAAGTVRVTWAAALERLLHAALDGLDPATAAGGRPGDRYQVIVHVDAQCPERSRIHLGPLLTRAQRRHLTCDADLRVVLHHGTRPVDVGRRHHTVDAQVRAVIEDRDRSCRCCGARGFLHIHHLTHWEDGGRTDLANLLALCTHCHRLVHTGGLRIHGDPTRIDGLTFHDQHGRPLPRPGPIPPPGPPPPARPYPGPNRGRHHRRFAYTITPDTGTRRTYAA